MDLYDQASPDEGGDAPETKESKDTDSTSETFLVPKSALGGKETAPGTKCEFEVVHEYEDEVEFKYLPHGEKKESTMDRADAAIDAMAAPAGAEE